MEISDVKNMIKTGNFPKYLIFHGPEHAIMKIYIDMIAKKGGYKISYADSLINLMIGARTKSLFNVPHIYIVMDDKEFMTNDNMWSFNGLKDDIVVFYYTSTDKRLKFWKHFKDEAVEFPLLDTRILTKYIQKDIDLSNESCEELIEICEHDYSRILLEIDKIKMYMGDKLLPDDAFSILVSDGTIYRPAKDAIFDFVAAVLERNPSKAYNLLDQSKRVGEANMVIISVLYNNIKTLLQVQSAKDYKKLGLNGFAVKNVIKYKNNYSNGELVKAMKLLRKCEIGIKTGEIPDELSVDYFLVNTI